MATGGAGGSHGIPWRAAGAGLVVILALAGAAVLRTGLDPAPTRPPQPVEAPSAAGSTPSTPPSPAPEKVEDSPLGLPRSVPTKIIIPKIKVNASLLSLGVNDDGSIQVPPLNRAMFASWYNLGPTPGEKGNAVIVGHVDSSVIGPAVFFKLGLVKAGDPIRVTRADGSIATFIVKAVKKYPKADFPSALVYGPADTANLQVVTCGGTFDRKTRTYSDNVVVSATLTTEPEL